MSKLIRIDNYEEKEFLFWAYKIDSLHHIYIAEEHEDGYHFILKSTPSFAKHCPVIRKSACTVLKEII